MIETIDEFLSYLKHERRYSEHSVTAYGTDLLQCADYLSERYERLEWGEVRGVELRSWVAEMAEGGMSARSINRKISALKSLFKYLLRNGRLEENPTVKLSTMKHDKLLMRTLSADEAEALMDIQLYEAGFVGVRDRLMMYTLYLTGMRRSELLSLKDSDLDFGEKTLKVLGKGNKERRIPIGDEHIDLIVQYQRERDALGLGKSGVLIVSESGKKVDPKLVYNVAKSYLSKVSTIERKSPHILRHTFATHLLDMGADLNTIKTLLGHANLSATQVYTHNSLEKLKQVYNLSHPRSTKDA